MTEPDPRNLQTTELDCNGEAKVCSGCGTTKTLEAIKAANPQALSCCPERKMVLVRNIWNKANQRDKLVAYPDHCIEPSRCAGKGYCPRDRSCVD